MNEFNEPELNSIRQQLQNVAAEILANRLLEAHRDILEGCSIQQEGEEMQITLPSKSKQNALYLARWDLIEALESFIFCDRILLYVAGEPRFTRVIKVEEFKKSRKTWFELYINEWEKQYQKS